MGRKYIIELEDKPFHKGDGDFLYRVRGFNSLVFDMTGVGKLTPYTEPDLEQVREEAYEDGYKTAKVQCNIQAEKDLREVGERHYQKGLSDAWEAARKICTNWVLPDSVLSKIFGMDKTIDDIMKENKASEAIEKIRQYEQEKEEIKVGDEVSLKSGSKGVVTRILMVGNEQSSAYVVWADGYVGCYDFGVLQKTGRRFPEIAAVLQKMRGKE